MSNLMTNAGSIKSRKRSAPGWPLRTFLTALLISASLNAFAADIKIGFVNTERVFREAAPALRAQKKLEKEFAPREQELQRLAKQARDLQALLERENVTLSDTERRAKERELANVNREFQRTQREVREDFNVRRNEEMTAVQERANRAIIAIAESEKFDLILQDVVFASRTIDITERVLKSLADK